MLKRYEQNKLKRCELEGTGSEEGLMEAFLVTVMNILVP
jgi:hypothetical protein